MRVNDALANHSEIRKALEDFIDAQSSALLARFSTIADFEGNLGTIRDIHAELRALRHLKRALIQEEPHAVRNARR